MQLKDKVAIVTGGSQGIGEAIATRYAREGAKVAILNRSRDTAAKVVETIQSEGGEAQSFSCDIGDPSAIERAVAEVIDHFGTVDVLINNAGAYQMSPVGATTPDVIDQMLSVNIRGVFLLSQAVLPEFEKKGGGVIINTGSIFGNDGFPGSAIYCGTKAAVHLMTKTMALELRDRKIRVNVIAPGWIETPLNEEFRATDAEFMRRASERFGGEGVWMKPEELAGTAVFLATNDAASITGTTTFVDRGWSAY